MQDLRRELRRAPTWVALFVLTPLVCNPLDRQLNEPTKVALALLLTGFLAGNALRRGGLPRLGRYRAEMWIGAYLLVRWLTTARSIAPSWSLWGDPAWRNGLWLTLAGAVLFGLARRQLAASQDQNGMITAILVSSALVSGYGLLQYAGLNPLHLPKDGPRVASTQSYPILLAAYLAMVIPLTLARWETGRRRRWIAGLLLLQGLCLIVSFSRAGWLAALGGAVVWGMARWWAAGRRRAAGAVLAVMCAGLAAMFLVSLLPPVPRDTSYALQTATSMFRWKGATVQTRLMGWQASLEAIRERPWLGYGPATFRTTFEWFMPPEFAPFDYERTLAGRTHNVFLEVAVESGAIGVAVYLAMIGAILFPLVRSVFGNGESPASLTFRRSALAALVAALIYSMFAFECAATVVLFWALAGMAHARPLPARPPVVSRLGGAAFVAGLVLAGWPLVPDMLAVQAKQWGENGRWESGVRLLEKTGEVAVTPEDMLLSLGRLYADRASVTYDTMTWEQGAAAYNTLLALRPDVAEYHKQRGDYLRRFFKQQGDPAAAQTAFDAYSLALRYSPHNPNLWIDRALLRIDMGDPAGALADLGQAGALLPDYTGYYGGMAIYALSQGDYAAAEAWNARALEAQRVWDAQLWSR